MNYRIALAATAALALAACGSKKPEATASDAPKMAEAAPSAAAPSAAPAAPGAAPAKGAKPAKEFVVGKWGNDGDCSLAINLNADGTSDGPAEKWDYSDGVISFPGVPEMKINVTVVDAKTMDSVNAQGGKHQMTRCP